MALFARKPIYISDRGDEFTIEKMSATHLMNAIAHHLKQITTIDFCIDMGNQAEDLANLHYRRINLHTTVEVLRKELLTRDPDGDYGDVR